MDSRSESGPMKTASEALAISEPRQGFFFVEGPASNWIIVRDGVDFMLIDSGYPADTSLVLDSIRNLGLDPAKAAALLVTHGHVDHTGGAAHFAETFGVPVLCGTEELPHVRGEVKYQVTLGQVLARAWRPRVFRWMLHALKAGSLKARPVVSATAWTAGQLRRLQRSPEAFVFAGHTPGNTVYYFRKDKVVVVGDAFVTGHPIARHTGPQMLHSMFHTDREQALAALSGLSVLDADLILPGHGPAAAMTLSEAIAAARK